MIFLNKLAPIAVISFLVAKEVIEFIEVLSKLQKDKTKSGKKLQIIFIFKQL